jgi:hypothetical protein
MLKRLWIVGSVLWTGFMGLTAGRVNLEQEPFLSMAVIVLPWIAGLLVILIWRFTVWGGLRRPMTYGVGGSKRSRASL